MTSSTEWRRQRLLNIGTATTQDNQQESIDQSNERSLLSSSNPDISSYGTIPSSRRRFRNNIPVFSAQTTTPLLQSKSTPGSPVTRRSKLFNRNTLSTYDPPPSAYKPNGDDYFQDSRFMDTKLNGIRVWYSSFTSVDWLHDAIKESTRLYRLRSRKSLRGKIYSNLDASINWIVVTIVGFLTAVTAFLIIRGEQWLFDLKEGRCLKGWWNARRFCTEWQEWSDAFGATDENRTDQWLVRGSWAVEYVIYIIVAVRPFPIPIEEEIIDYNNFNNHRDWQLCLAAVSCFLTIKLTASPTFVSNKDSGVLGPDFQSSSKAETSPLPKRKVLFFVCPSHLFHSSRG